MPDWARLPCALSLAALLSSGLRLPVGTHLWEHGTVLRINDGTKVAEIPLSARFHKAVLDHVDALLNHVSEPSEEICDGRIDPVPAGLDSGWASVVANDDMGGRAAVVGMQLYRQLTCHPEAQSSIEILALLGKLGRRGPTRGHANIAEQIEPSAKRLSQGQLHHAISRRVHRALEEHRVLRGRYQARDPRFVLRGADAHAHRGYQKWHQDLDDEIVRWLDRNNDVPAERFEAYLRSLYERTELKQRFPRGFEARNEEGTK